MLISFSLHSLNQRFFFMINIVRKKTVTAQPWAEICRQLFSTISGTTETIPNLKFRNPIPKAKRTCNLLVPLERKSQNLVSVSKALRGLFVDALNNLSWHPAYDGIVRHIA